MESDTNTEDKHKLKEEITELRNILHSLLQEVTLENPEDQDYELLHLSLISLIVASRKLTSKPEMYPATIWNLLSAEDKEMLLEVQPLLLQPLTGSPESIVLNLGLLNEQSPLMRYLGIVEKKYGSEVTRIFQALMSGI